MTQKTIDIRVGSKLYGRTTCVVNVADKKNINKTIKGGIR